MEIQVDPRARSTSLEDLVQQMLPMNLTNVVALRPEYQLSVMSPEEAFIAWTMDLPAQADVASEARAAIVQLQALKLRHRHEALDQFEGYLRDAVTAMPVNPRRRRRRPGSRRGRS